MSTEFTGERVIPGQVDLNLWNEHIARYAFAARLSRNKRVLDAGCGTGYGSANLSSYANAVCGIDLGAEAIQYATQNFSRSNVHWARGSCTKLPFRNGCFDLVIAFEVIEHLENWRGLLIEARRVLTPGGQFIVSTPNKSFYAESRAASGPNPFHTHEFEFEEFRAALREVFPHVSLFLEDHTEGILFKSVSSRGSADVRLEGAEPDPNQSNFFIAVCATMPQTGSPTFVYLPSSANLLKERGEHIVRLERELAMKNEWLDQARNEHQQLVQLHTKQTAELQASNRWAEQLNEELGVAAERITQLQKELLHEQHAALQVAQGYADKVAELEADVAAKAKWAIETEARLSAELQAKCDELARCVEILHQSEQLTEERTQWAMRLDQDRQILQAKLDMVQASRWLKLGRTFGVGPQLGFDK